MASTAFLVSHFDICAREDGPKRGSPRITTHKKAPTFKKVGAPIALRSPVPLGTSPSSRGSLSPRKASTTPQGWAGFLARGSSYSPRLPIRLWRTVARADFITAYSCGAAVDSPRIFGDTPLSLAPSPICTCYILGAAGTCQEEFACLYTRYAGKPC